LVGGTLQAVEDEILGVLDCAERIILHGLLALLNLGEADYGLAANED
jgi:hypothetical protein